MGKKTGFVLLIPFMLATLWGVMQSNHVGVKASSDYRVHNIESGLSYATIQEAIDAPETLDGHTIFAQEGIYCESVVLSKTNLALIGENRYATVISSNIGVAVALKGNDTRIKGFTIQNGSYGIKMSPWTHGHIIEGNIISDNGYGVSGYYDCSDVSICDNIITSNRIAGIYMLFSNSIIGNNLISGNREAEGGYGIQIGKGVDSKAVYCVDDTVFGNMVENCRIGIWALQYSEGNLFFHNNFVNNSMQACASVATWNNSATENYWSDYDGTDANRDGIGDVPYNIGDIVRDERPLMGAFHDFNTSLGHHVNVVSNSTVEDFEYVTSSSTVRMHVSNMSETQTWGFCRVCIPHALMNVSDLSVVIDSGVTPVLYHNYTLYDNGTHRWIYFSYQHSLREIVIIPEFSSYLALPILTIVILLAVKSRFRASCREKEAMREQLC